MKTIEKLLILLFFTVPWQLISANPHTWDSSTEQQILDRLDEMDHLYPVVNSADVLSQIRHYVVSGKRDTEYMLGRAEHFFPIFDRELKHQGLPLGLKYITVIESGLRPNALSPVGASGLWQMMGTSARHYGLRVNNQIDERMDAYKSTQAAVQMLSDLYNRFGDWSLALAAYNCGAGRVLKAIELGNSTHYGRIAHLLPRETRKYLIRFTAAAYVVENYARHGLEVVSMNPAWQNTGLWISPERVTFRQITQVTGLSYAEIGQLNPAVTNGYWPASSQGNFIVLPTEAIAKLKDHMDANAGPQVVFASPQAGESRLTYTVNAEDDIHSISRQFGIQPEDLARWNFLPEDRVFPYQVLELYVLPTYYLSKA